MSSGQKRAYEDEQDREAASFAKEFRLKISRMGDHTLTDLVSRIKHDLSYVGSEMVGKHSLFYRFDDLKKNMKELGI